MWLRVFALLVALATIATADVDGLVLADRLGAKDRAEVDRAVADIERAPTTTPYLDDALREAGRVCEDVLADPPRALAIYERILREFPNGSASRVARVRAKLLRDRIGTNNAYAAEAKELAELVTSADKLQKEDVSRRAHELSLRDWPGAPDAALFLAEWHQRRGEHDQADRAYSQVSSRWPDSPQALTAKRGAASVAIADHDWARAELLVRGLPAVDDTDRVLRDELLERIALGRRIDFWYHVAWALLVGAVLALLASLLEAARRGGWRKPSLKPPVEVFFLLPIGAVLVGVALTTHQAIAPAVVMLTLGGIALAWISGMGLELLRVHRRRVGPRGAMHALLCFLAVVSLLYIVLTHDNLLEMMIETVRFGPDP